MLSLLKKIGKFLGGITVNILPNVQGWFVHFRDIIFQPITIRDQTIFVLADSIEAANIGDLKKIIQTKAIRLGVEPFLNKVVKEKVEPLHPKRPDITMKLKATFKVEHFSKNGKLKGIYEATTDIPCEKVNQNGNDKPGT